MTPELPKHSGIYFIRNTCNGKVYIGSAVNVHERLTDHRRALTTNRHANRHLQAAWLRYGCEAFVFGLVQACDRSVLLFAEQLELDRLVAECGWPMLYNIAPKAGAPMAGRTHASDARDRISAARKAGKRNMLGKHHSDQTKAKMRAASLGKPHPHKGHPIDESTRLKIGAANRARTRPRTGENNGMFGKKHSAEVRGRISAVKKGIPWTKARRDAQERVHV